MSASIDYASDGRASVGNLYSPGTLKDADGDINIKPSAQVMSPRGATRRTFRERTFSKLEKGSLRGSMFALCSAAIGGGVLSLPYAMVLIGWANTYILFVVATVSGIWSNLMLVRIAI